MASNDTPTSSARLSRAEVPPADYWQRWSVGNAPPAEAVRAHIAAAPAAAPEAGQPAAAETPYRVLIVEDDRSQALFAQSVLHGAGMQAIVQMDAEGVQQAIAEHRPDLILMDLHMPGLDGMRLTALIRQNPQQQLLPIVFLTGDPDPERQFEVLDSGADDFLTKPIRPRHLVAAVANRIRRSRQQSQGTAEGVALSNPETGLPTRHNLMLQLDAALAAAEHGGLMFIEIASALGLRERYGYAAFERLMMQAGRRLAEAARPHLLARLNDNSFLLLGRGMDEDAVDALARSVRQALSAHPFVVRDDESLHLRCAVGHARLSQGFEDAGIALEAVERTALQARLLADGVAAHQGNGDAAAQEHLALLEGQIELAYQPIVAVAGSDTAQYQVLLRLRRNDGTLLSAGQVIPAAEAAGRIGDLDQQVLDHALGLLHRYQHAVPPMRLFVSQSLRSLAREAFAGWLLKAIADRQIAGSSLVIDVRLGDALVHAVTLQQFCERLMPAGVQFCLSQFEPGDEANALMTQLPLGFVRMAGRFAGSHASQQLRDELRGAIDAAHRAGLQIIGQQIEDPQAAAAMWMSGIDFIQGNVVQSVGSELDFDFQNTVL
ncbi:EAL domain-containing protein [Stenotrophomonas acidaminiphila]|jgi:PleD family two-component response regulator/EAL domain-containing protein (putative c-di-GMP-specific phosphodiesterase class I)|uniref:GGDEF signaling protein n=1 Tax=Stenotrophomonas acidaminiphila TaxID=128780 RepID=A0A0R0DXB8_9GAMM|nr:MULTISPECIES: EAL domain-containing response regulator [Stenotrophomonas]OZB53161.1 MAG: response regulator receiver protein [Stenotrophomonas sp. 14-69-23]ALJ29493.1 GGDEF signaling protein [Stenotrophomonas acidaminiphila]KRG82120.1 response regulator receiver protein [Stenotrophomonas acidaminiphila]QOF98188.1 EAL domain-containing protein [Stenotrophomonas sp. CW117]WHL18465.1 EAL domain-containing protein [Stenotrophomonas acidaminiphila]